MTIEIGTLIAVSGLIISFLAYQFNRQKELKSDTREDGEIKAQLGYISKGVDDIRIELRASEKQIGALGERVTRVEESAKQAHKRIDNLEKEGN
ncbi:hypothetical protein [Cytobacillus firmus]|uniref:hypothetical protein n=1 Tax=Cytobacillus firmus TaxID=1399 RepID=UPI0018CE8BE6|nr:hypothetical protein [Cytobacillus firmus]MBG9548363.1 hypothetical protein [Cytobacillus firmus]MBG9600787.1 hypothetical protein [Cytobacillus firmus]MBG9657805.1 hypothetical protein [Cytobacillus firmus]MED1904803.1 hypothetical protein [Cytobacillus firmus]MED1938961.1 hypothetical protein [Cytobacillus firmus]